MPENSLTPFSDLQSSGLDLNLAMAQAQKMIALLRQLGIKEATFESGVYFSHDQRDGANTLATDGVLVQQRLHTTSITFRHQESTEQEVLQELKSLDVTQKAQGAVSGGKSQPWVSTQHAQDESDA